MRDRLIRAWSVLLVLGLATAALSLLGPRSATTLTGIAIIVIGFCKARIILAHYLELAAAPAWLRMTAVVGALYGLLLIGLYVLPLAMR